MTWGTKMSGYIQLQKSSTVQELILTLQKLHPEAIVKIAIEDALEEKKVKRFPVSGLFYNDKEIVLQSEED